MTQHIAIQARNENFNYTVIIERTPELEALVRSRMDLAATVKKQDKDCWGLMFSFYDFEVYEDVDDVDLEEALENDGVALLDKLPKLPRRERIDYGTLVIDSDSVYLRFGIKHVPEIEETGSFETALFSKKSR